MLLVLGLEWGWAAAEDPTAELRFAPAGGAYAGRVSIKLSGPTGEIRYTLNGSDPTNTSHVYAGSIELLESAFVRARVFAPGQPPGPIQTEVYVVVEPALEKFNGNLPVVVLNTFGQAIDRSEKTPAAACLFEPRQGRVALMGSASLASRALVHYRGKSSLRYLKRSYALALVDDESEPRKASLLELPSDNDWVLYAPFPDKTLLRDVLAYELFNQMGHYATRTRYVEVFVNEGRGRLSQRHYMGVFVLEEKTKRGKNRVDVKKLTPEDNAEPAITGGYIFKKDHTRRTEDVTPSLSGRPTWTGGGGGMNFGYSRPTGPGGFPADPRSFELAANIHADIGVTYQNPTPFVEPIHLETPPGLRVQASPTAGAGTRPNGSASRVVVSSPSWTERLAEGLRTWARGLNQPQPTPQRTWTTTSSTGVGRSGFGKSESGEDILFTRHRNEFFFVEPKQEKITLPQKQWLLNYLDQFENALYGPHFRDPVKGYAAYIDVDSFIDHHLMVEVSKNVDGFRFSTFFTKDRNGKIRMEPIWDWNLSFGNCNGKQGWLPEYWYWPQLNDQQYSWFRRLFEDPDFGQRYVDRYAQLRRSVFATTNLLARVDALALQLDEPQRRNFERWPVFGKQVWPNHYIGQTYQDEVAYLKGWTVRRLTWIDQQFAPTPSVQTNAAGQIVLTAGNAAIFFTTDGQDPRASGGQLAASARPYSAPIPVQNTPHLQARSRVDNRWSAPVRL